MTEKPQDKSRPIGRSYNWRDGDGRWPHNDMWEEFRATESSRKPTVTGLGSLFACLFPVAQSQDALKEYQAALDRAEHALKGLSLNAEEAVRLYGQSYGVTSWPEETN